MFLFAFCYHSVYNFPMANENDSTENHILKTATKLFSEKGFDAVGVQEIVDKSGITKPTLYYYFKSKTGLLESIINQNESAHIQILEKSAVYEHKFFESLLKILKAEIDYAERNTDYFRFRINLLNSPEESESFSAFFPFAKKIEKLFLEFFKNSANEFGNMKGKEELYSAIFSSNICSIARQVLSGSMKVSDEILYSIIHSFVYGFAD